MKTTNPYQYLPSNAMLYGLIFFGLVWAGNAQGQKRAPDLILTVKKDTLSVIIIEVGIFDLKYKSISGDTISLYTLSKSEVLKVFYGNGDEEQFISSDAVPPVRLDRRYYKMTVRTPFQKEIALWSTDKLLVSKELYRQKYITQRATGIAAFPVGAMLAAVGFAQAIASLFSSDEPKGAVAFTSGIVIATGVGIPLTVLGSKNKKKYKAITMELELRGVGVD